MESRFTKICCYNNYQETVHVLPPSMHYHSLCTITVYVLPPSMYYHIGSSFLAQVAHLGEPREVKSYGGFRISETIGALPR